MCWNNLFFAGKHNCQFAQREEIIFFYTKTYKKKIANYEINPIFALRNSIRFKFAR